MPALSGDFLDYINPLQYFTMDEYTSIWTNMFATILSGFWARCFAWTCLVLALYFIIRRQRYTAGATFMVIAALLAYGGALFKFFTS